MRRGNGLSDLGDVIIGILILGGFLGLLCILTGCVETVHVHDDLGDRSHSYLFGCCH